MLYMLAQTEEPGYFTQALIDFITWMIDWLCTLIKPWVEWILEYIPSDWLTTLDTMLASFTPYFAAVNAWVALDWAASILTAWFLFAVTFITVKLIVKIFVPMTG